MEKEASSNGKSGFIRSMQTYKGFLLRTAVHVQFTFDVVEARQISGTFHCKALLSSIGSYLWRDDP